MEHYEILTYNAKWPIFKDWLKGKLQQTNKHIWISPFIIFHLNSKYNLTDWPLSEQVRYRDCCQSHSTGGINNTLSNNVYCLYLKQVDKKIHLYLYYAFTATSKLISCSFSQSLCLIYQHHFHTASFISEQSLLVMRNIWWGRL